MSSQAQGADGAGFIPAGQSLDLRDLHAANIARQAEWCPDQVPDLSFRGNELGGECGEAQNVIKKLERERQGWRGSRATKDDLADELADVVICADLCAVTADIDLGAAVRRKFNATSEKQGLSVFLPSDPAALATPRTDSAERTAGAVREALKELREAAADMLISLPAHWHDDATIRLTDAAADAETVLSAAEQDDLYDLAASAPSSPGVPDSVRALSEAATQGEATFEIVPYHLGDTGDADLPGFLRLGGVQIAEVHEKYGPGVDPRYEADGKFVAAAINFVRALLSAHPAGQSTGQEVETEQCERCQGNGEIVTDWERYLHGEPDDAGDEGTADCPDCGGIGEINPPAPDSPLTGPVGVEEDKFDQRVQAALAAWKEAQDTATVDEHQEDTDFGAMMCALAAANGLDMERVRHVKRGTEYAVLGVAEAQVSCRADGTPGSVRALFDGCRLTIYRGSDGKLWCRFTDEFSDGRFLTLAARPAAPEAQGAWRERAATEIDAIAHQWGAEGNADGRAYAKTLAAILRAEQPAPPSSGQGGR